MNPAVKKFLSLGMPQEWEELCIYGEGDDDPDYINGISFDIEDVSLTKEEAAALILGLGDDNLDSFYMAIQSALFNSSKEVQDMVAKMNKRSAFVTDIKIELGIDDIGSMDCGVVPDSPEWIEKIPSQVLTDSDFRYLLTWIESPEDNDLEEEVQDRVWDILQKNCAVRTREWFSDWEIESVVQEWEETYEEISYLPPTH